MGRPRSSFARHAEAWIPRACKKVLILYLPSTRMVFGWN